MMALVSQSLNLGGHQGTTDDVAKIPFHPSLSSAALRESPNPIPIHSLMLSHLFSCLLLLVPFTGPCRIVFDMPEGLEMWPYHPSFLFFTMVRGSSCTPVAFWILLRTSSFVGNIQVSCSTSSQGLGSFFQFLLSRSSSHRHKGRVDKMSVRISLTLEASEMFLSLHMIFSLERAAAVWAILKGISGFDPSLEMIAAKYLEFSSSFSLWPFILISLWKPFVVCHHFSLVWASLHFVSCGGCIEMVYHDASF